MVANLKAKTGKTMTRWLAIAKRSGEEKHGKTVAHLKSEHGMTHGFANLIALRHLRSGEVPVSDAQLVDAQYAGPKAALRPIYVALIAKAKKLGNDVELAPRQAYVALRRSKQFALIQPSTRTRVDLGLNLRGVKPTGRLEASGSFSGMCTHRVRLERVKDVDRELLAWVEQAYRGAAAKS